MEISIRNRPVLHTSMFCTSNRSSDSQNASVFQRHTGSIPPCRLLSPAGGNITNQQPPAVEGRDGRWHGIQTGPEGNSDRAPRLAPTSPTSAVRGSRVEAAWVGWDLACDGPPLYIYEGRVLMRERLGDNPGRGEDRPNETGEGGSH
ncbi:hypothetical protein DPEC_G00027410 [Dallia pectoralis]|uniref:Uncharacterized protein n=1 Tax=Dallia pectoralis TaxID=75939 RepID=A0ACC2HI98_DALPE|nr:hypothetical protein DPEC_G00027410 [Dallia pectoralis]